MNFKRVTDKIQCLLVWGFWIIFLSFSAFHFYVLYVTVVDIPFMDEWFLFDPHGITSDWSWNFLFKFHNEHRLLVTRLLYYFNYKLFGLNFRYQILFDAVIFAGIVAMIYWLLIRKNGLKNNLAALICLGVFATTLPFEIHSWAILSNMAIVLGGLLGGTYLLFCSRKWSSLFWALALFYLAIFSFPGAIGSVMAIVFCYIIHAAANRGGGNLYRTLLTLVVTGLSIAAWFVGYHKNPGHPPYQMPWTLSFLKYFAELTSLGFGFTTVNPLISWLCLVLVLLAICAAAYRIFRFDQDRPARLFSLVFCLGVLAMMACIALGRSGFGIDQAKSSRYAVIPMFLPVLSIILFSFVPKWRNFGWVSISVLLIFGISNHLNMSEYYLIRSGRLKGKFCLKRLYLYPETNPKGVCPDLYPPVDLTEHLRKAKQLNVHFTQTWRKN